MYKVIIADDEKIIQEGLSNLVDWQELGFEIVATFGDGEDVIEYLETMPVDVVLTDICMVHLSGIDIARYVQESNLSCKVVFVSGHKEFELALQGIKYGVEDYILKPTKVKEVKDVFSKLKKYFDERNRDIKALKKAEEQWKETRPLLEEKFLNSLIMGATENTHYIDQRMKLLYPELDAKQCPCALVNLEIKEYQTFIGNRWSYSSEQFDDAVYNFVRLYEGDAFYHILYKSKNKIKLFVILKRYCETTGENTTKCWEQIQRFKAEFSEIFQLEITVEVEQFFENIYQVIDHRDAIVAKNIRQEDARLHVQEQKKLVMSNIMQGNISTAQNILQNIIKSIGQEDSRYRNHFLVDLFVRISDFLKENNPSLFLVVQPFINYTSIFDMTAEAEILAYCNRIFNKMKTKESLADNFDKDSLIHRVKEYVQNHIFEDILLENVANELFLSTAHLSRFFKKQTGENFSQYVTRMKIEKAVELLHNPQYRVYQVGEMLGYKTTRYFSKLFFNFTGYYPSQYRKEVLNMGEIADEEE